jgi:lipopolysaccharide export system protein LptA
LSLNRFLKNYPCPNQGAPCDPTAHRKRLTPPGKPGNAEPPADCYSAWAVKGTFLLGLFLLPSFLAAAEPPPRPSSGTLRADFLEYRSTDSAVVARGNVVLVSSSVRIVADEIVVNNRDRTARAYGNVYIEDGDTRLLGESAEFDWAASTGVIHNGYVVSPPWRMWGREIVRVDEERYRLKRAAMTSCDLDPPHYHFRGSRGRYRHKKRATVYNGRLALEDTEVFYTPVYTRSLKDRRWTLRVDPGQSGRDGLYAKSMFGYPLTDNTYMRLYWDHFQKTGNGYGAEYSYFRPEVTGSLYTYRITDRVADTERWNFRAGHSQRLTQRFSLQANALFQSDSDFNNRFFRDDFERVKQRAESDLAVTYAHPLYSARLSTEHDRLFDPLRNGFVTERTLAPHLNIQTSPLLIGNSVYATLAGNFRNEYTRPLANPPAAEPIVPEKDLFRQSADASLDLSKTMALTKRLTFVPSAGISETWLGWRDTGLGIDRADLYQGRVFTRAGFRHRLTRALDYDLAHNYRVRWAPNQMQRDHSAADQGTEQNSVDLFLSMMINPRFWVRAGSGYDLRKPEGETIESVRQKIAPPSAEINFSPARGINLFYRQSFLLYPVRVPQTAQFSFSAGREEELRFHTGYSYNFANPGQLQVRHGAAFPLTAGWWLDGGVQYNAAGPEKTRYESVRFLEKYIIVKRDLHCWQFRAEVRQRPGGGLTSEVNEVFFRLDLKTNIEAREELSHPDEEQYYPARDRES